MLRCVHALLTDLTYPAIYFTIDDMWETPPQVKQREESAGLGIEEHDRAKGRETWWYDSFEAALQSVKVAATGSDGEGGKKKKYVGSVMSCRCGGGMHCEWGAHVAAARGAMGSLTHMRVQSYTRQEEEGQEEGGGEWWRGNACGGHRGADV